jgi:hypothetical protein
MGEFPGSPRVLKGAIVGIDIMNPLASVIVFQYNPETVTRTLKARSPQGDDGDTTEALRIGGAPIETIKLDAELDATDQLETGDGIATSMGIYPQLSALEMLLYPKSTLVIANTVLMAIGMKQIVPPLGPLTLLIWGLKRVLPVRVDEFTITEEAHDASLNPIRAKVSLGMRVLTYSDLSVTNPGYHVFLAHQIVKEVMATISSVNAIGSAAGGSVKLF